jgi:hypothetical protein
MPTAPTITAGEPRLTPAAIKGRVTSNPDEDLTANARDALFQRRIQGRPLKHPHRELPSSHVLRPQHPRGPQPQRQNHRQRQRPVPQPEQG